jgi:hypothetical protein
VLLLHRKIKNGMKKKTKIFSFLFCIILTCGVSTVKGQDVVSGNVKDTDNNAILGALIVIVDANENLISSEITDSTGRFSMTLPANLDNHWLILNSFGYSTQKLALSDAVKQKLFVLETNIQNLELVTISANRPNLVREMDKFVVPQIYNSELAKGKNIVDFLGFTPLIRISEDGELGILGKGRATIYINGRKSEIDLKSIPAENIEKVEIIASPGSQYPATDRAGIINVVLRRPPEDGVLANITIGDRQQEKGILNSPSLSLFLNIQKKKVNITTGFSTSYSPRIMEEKGVYHYYLDSIDMNTNSNNFRQDFRLNAFVNMDYHINKKHTLGFRIDASTSYRKENNDVGSNYCPLNSNEIDSSYFTNAELKMKKPNISIHANFNYDITFNSNQKLSFDWDYRHNVSGRPDYFQNINYNRNDTLFSGFRTQSSTVLDAYNFTSRFQHKFTSDMHLNAGLECYGVIVKTDYFYGNQQQNDYVSDPLRSNVFLFKDITGAIYVDYDWEISDIWSLSAGLRGEYYAYKGISQTTGEIISGKYPGIFPSLSLYFAPSDNHEFAFDFTSKQGLPGSSMFNPFKTYFSPFLYQENNPDIRPYKDYDFSLEYTLFSDYMFILEYDYSKNLFNEFRMPVGSGITKITTINYGNDHDFMFDFSITKKLFNNYLYLSFDVAVDYYIATNISKEIVAYNASGIDFSTDLKINTALNKKKDWRFETRFQYCPEWTYISTVVGTAYNLSASISKNFKSSTLSFGVSDIIDMPHKSSLSSEIYAYELERYYYGRTYWVSFSIKFGNNKSRGTENRKIDKTQQRLQ